MLLKDKIVIVSGIGPGLGRKLAYAAAREGASGLAISARTESRLDEVADEVEKMNTGCEVLKVATDITDRGQCKRLADQTAKRFGRIDGLVNSGFYHGGFDNIEEPHFDEWRQQFETNCIGTVQMSLAAAEHMKKSGGGAIVNINTMAVRKPFPPEPGYAASKGALAVATKYLAQGLGQYGIRANSIHMGWMWGDPVKGYVEQVKQEQGLSEQEILAPVKQEIPLGEVQTDEDCANAALMLVSDYTRSVTGASLDSNGGHFMP